MLDRRAGLVNKSPCKGRQAMAGAAEPDDARRMRALAELLDLRHDAIFARGMDDRISFWSAGAAALYGWKPEEAIGKNARELLAAKYAEAPEQVGAILHASGRWDGEIERVNRAGTPIVVAARWALLRDGAGAPVEILETGRDVTARIRAAEELQKSEFRYRNMFQAMAVSFWELDFTGVGLLLRKWKASGVTDLRRFLYDNPALVREAMTATRAIDVNEKSIHLFRAQSRAALLGPIDRYWPPQSQHVYLESVIAAIGGKPYYEAECSFRAADGHIFDALFTVSFPTGAVGRGNILVGIIDMTERNRARDALARVQAELAHAVRVTTLGELAGSIAHEVNQPLAAIVTNGEASLRWLGRAVPDLGEAKTAMSRAIADAQRAAGIIARVRDMAAKRAPERMRLGVNALVADAAALVAHEVAAHAVALKLDLADAVPEVEADKVQLQQVLVNLFVNAIQAMAAQSGPRSLVVRSRRDEGFVVIEVEDSGPGIDADAAQRLFDAFYTTKPSGMGLGLSICRSIVEAHGGTIACTGEPGSGAVFRFTVPVASA